MSRMKLGETLRKAALITQEQLDNALILQKGTQKRLGKLLIELGYIDEDQVAHALAEQLSLPVVDCSTRHFESILLTLVPRDTAESRRILPLELSGNKLLVAMADPCDWQTVDDLSFRTGLIVTVAIAAEGSLSKGIERCYGSTDNVWDLISEFSADDKAEFIQETDDDKTDVNVNSLYKSSESKPIVRLVNMIFSDAVKSGASDIHIEPQERNVQVRFRVDGELRSVLKIPKQIQESVISRIKIISCLDITNRRLPQDGRSSLRLDKKTVDLRISTLPSVYGEKVVVRILRPDGITALSHLGINEQMLHGLIQVVSQPQGMLLVTGPTGSGKTTTLYAIIQQLQSETENLITIEDPVEYRLPGITQVNVKDSIGLTFASALRSILRQDPDIIMLGEIRDQETAEIAARGALTGHFVLSTLHTNDTVATITRLLDMKVAPFLIISAISAVLAQRLVRRICPSCIEEAQLPDDLRLKNLPPLTACYRGKGCNDCHHTGYKGRIGVHELLVLDSKLKGLISRQADEDELWRAARTAGMVPLFENAWSKVGQGLTTVEEVLSKVPWKIDNFDSRNGKPGAVTSLFPSRR